MFGLFKKKDERPMVVVTLNARLQPIHRSEMFEEPLDLWLRAEGFGEVCGGRTAFDPFEGVKSCDIELRLAATDDATLAQVLRKLEMLGAPMGSMLKVDAREMPLGASDGLALHLNGVDLPDEVYAETSLDELADKLNAALAGKAKVMSHWSGERETSLFVYGAAYNDMAAAIAPVMGAYPLCQRARLEKIA